MIEQNWKMIIILLVAFVGISFEVLKHTQTRDSLAWDVENLQLAKSEPYAVRHEPGQPPGILGANPPQKPAPAPKVLHEELQKFIAANQPVQTEAEKKPLDAKAAAAAKKKEKDDEWEEVIDPKTGKKVRRKKKKDAKKEEKKVEVAAKVEVKREPPENEISAAVDDAVMTGGFPASETARPPFTGLEEWRRLLLTTPNLAETRVFIQHYQDNLVSAEVFYKLVNEMIADSRTEMKQLGVMCAGVTPSVISFTILAGVEKTEATASAVRNQATGFLSHYATLTYAHILRSIMSGSDPYTQLIATQELDQLVRHYIPNARKPPQNPQALAAANTRNFSPFVRLLHALTASSNSQVRQQATQTLATIQSIVSTQSVASTTL